MRISPVLGVSALLLAAGVLSCAETSDYVYTPDMPNATAAGLPAVRTPIPQERPEGAIEVTSYGMTSLRNDGVNIPSLHVRAIVTNDGDDTPWRLDTTQQMLAIAGEGTSRAMFVNSDVGTLPSVTIGRHERRVLDFYFPLPDTIQRESQLPRFDLLWQVVTPARTVASRTTFERVDRQPDVAYYDDFGYPYGTAGWPLWAGYGPYWWYDPFYPSVVFVHSHPIAIHHPGHPGHVTVGRFGGHFSAAGHMHVGFRGAPAGHHR